MLNDHSKQVNYPLNDGYDGTADKLNQDYLFL